MSERAQLDPAALDRYITGNYGEDQFSDEWPQDPREATQDLEAVEYELRAAQAEADPRSDEWFSLQVQLRSVVRRLRGMGDV